jgi:hypothetical protein
MTPSERRNPLLIKASRNRRMAFKLQPENAVLSRYPD